jgi:NADPH:quinone reductase-like Zn-dependent oxidoreductase
MKLKRVIKWGAGAILVALVAGALVAYWTSSNDCDRKTGAPSNPMKAIVHCEYGSPDVLKLEDIEKPTPVANEVLVRVRAAALNPADGHLMRGPFIARLMAGGLRKPKVTRLGADFAGTVEAVGKNVTRFKPGDEVFGARTGAFAEYVCVREDRGVALKPANMTFEQAASVPVAAITALQGLRDKGKIQSGQRVLINGASGGVGTFAVQITKSLGAEVTAVCSTANVDMVRSLGADRVIDYTKEDFTKDAQSYDLIFDNVGNHSFSERRRVLTPDGICVLSGIGGAGEHAGQWGHLAENIKAALLSRFVKQKFVMFITQLNQNDLNILRDLTQSEKVTPVIDRQYKLRETAEAMRYLEEGHARGKVVITME